MNARAVFHRSRLIPLLVLALVLILAAPVHGQEEPATQEITGTIADGGHDLYLLPGLRQGQMLSVYMENTGGNLDPAVALLGPDQTPQEFRDAYLAAISESVAAGQDPIVAVLEARDRYALRWDDDSGPGLTAAFSYELPQDGDYHVVTGGALSAQGVKNAGDYRLVIGLDAPGVLQGEALPVQSEIARPVLDATHGVAVEERTGSLIPTQPSVRLPLLPLKSGDVLYAYIEATSSDLHPTLTLRNYADKPVAIAISEAQEISASLQYTVAEPDQSYTLEVAGPKALPGAEPATGDYRLLLGVNEPAVLTGQGTPTEATVVQAPTPVQAGVEIDKITEVNQTAEYFNVVANIRLEWRDPALAFSPDTCNCTYRVYTESQFGNFLDAAHSRWPSFYFANQQGNRVAQNRIAGVFQDGRIVYFERFSANMHVDFDFRQYPFDTQTFYIVVDSLASNTLFVFEDLPGFTGVDPNHGQDEFIVGDVTTAVTTTVAGTGATTSRYTMAFDAPRHLVYYVLQVFLPVLLIIVVSYVTFFLRDYGRRIEVATGNLLLFIAFSFSLANNYPHLGYMTFLDSVMTTTFFISALVVIYNVWLRRLQMQGRSAVAERVDSYLDWLYPIGYLVAGAVLYYWFFIRL